jgi:hypothetical protein
MSEPKASPERTAPAEAAATPEPAASRPESTRTGPGRLLVAIYGLFALSASARAGVQIATKFGHAPVAYLLSAFAGVVYIIATVTLSVGEAPGADRAMFPDATVWSGYGSGYGFVPLVLPVFGLLWLRYWARRPKSGGTIVASAEDAGQAAGGGVASGESVDI